jgi:hypothetical protein
MHADATAQSDLQPILLTSRGIFMPPFAEKQREINGMQRTLTPLILVRIQDPQPAKITFSIQ